MILPLEVARVVRRLSHPDEAPLLEDAEQLDLDRLVELADLVEEDRVVGPAALLQPPLAVSAPMKAPLMCPNSSDSISVGTKADRLSAVYPRLGESLRP